MINESCINGFILLGFTGQPQLEMIISGVVFFCYTVALTGNMAIILLSFLDEHLQTPMYFFLRNLAILDLCYTTNIVPQMLVNIWGQDKRITFGGCAFQLFNDVTLCIVECILLAVMSYDRFIAVCKPLHYMTVMSAQLCQALVVMAWVISVINCLILSPYAMSLPRCGNHHLDHFFCEISAMVKIACVDTTAMEVTIFVVCLTMGLVPLLLILVSYGFITVAVLKIKSVTGRQKAFGTCSSHLIVVSIFYGTLIYMYIQPGNSPNQNEGKFLSIFYSIITPSLNPLIYTLRNKKFKGAMKRLTRKEKHSMNTTRH
ncbi:PREDICTED: olfactory receptor 2W1-like [Elephantulus edwardii]|uniref:olfactory receptor 2W1-like n=1 Tax=Elephantulus edwardii TaxID=28737 RepID=UPI0003F0CB66|nr:PREDICTED: olfactory receptor 2W1-like [Elephantulus edwardii]